MLNLSISTNQEAIKDVTGGGSFVNGEGVFDVLLNFVSVDETKNKAVQVNFNIDYKGNQQTIYGPIVKNTNGEENAIGMSLLNKLGVIAGMGDGDNLIIEEETHKVGKDQKPMTFQVITNFSDLACKLRTQREYSTYNGEIRRSLRIRNVFSEDGASASEITQDADQGKQLAIELEKYSSTPSYLDGVTPEQAEAYEQAQRNNSKGNVQPKSATTEKRSGMFG